MDTVLRHCVLAACCAALAGAANEITHAVGGVGRTENHQRKGFRAVFDVDPRRASFLRLTRATKGALASSKKPQP